MSTEQIDQQDDVIERLSHQGPEPVSTLGLQRQITTLDHRTEGMDKLVGRVNMNSVSLINMQALIDDIHDAMPTPTDDESLIIKIMSARIPKVYILGAINARIEELEIRVELDNAELATLSKYKEIKDRL